MDEHLEKTLELYPQLSFRKHWELSPECLYMLGECDAIVQSLLFLPLSPEIRSRMLEVAFVKGAAATTAIEGNTLSEEDVEAIRRGTADIPPSRKYQEQEVKNVLDALNAIREDVVARGVSPSVSPSLLRAFHAKIGKDLGESFQAVPGQYRPHEVVVGAYRPPDHRAVPALVDRLCEWLAREFRFVPDAPAPFLSTVVEAVVAHVYLAWIHPFGDGNGRTARLLEFFVLLRGGLPDICSHVLSNHYNETRGEYYRRLAEAGRSGDLSAFLLYAVAGLRDGLRGLLAQAQRQQIGYCWAAFVHAALGKARLSSPVRERLRALLAGIGPFRSFSAKTLPGEFPKAALLYAKHSPSTLARDIRILESLGLLEQGPGGVFAPAVGPLLAARLPAAVRQR